MKIAIVTGGARGIGEAVVEVFVASGATVVFCDLDPDLGRRGASSRVGDRAKFVQGRRQCRRRHRRHGRDVLDTRSARPSILVNNAGVNANFDATTMTGDDWDRFMGVDLKSAWLGAKYVLPHMREVGRGAIVNVASMHALATLEGFFPYAAAKSGLVGMTRSLALDWGPTASASTQSRPVTSAPAWCRTASTATRIPRPPSNRW